MKYFKINALILFSVVLFSACTKDVYQVYTDVARLQFGPSPDRIYNATYDLYDTLKRQTFYYDEPAKTMDTVYFDLYAIGGTRDYDRSFTLQQVQLSNEYNAEPGKHYLAFDDSRVSSNYVIKAGTVRTAVPIVVLRDASLKTNTAKLKFLVVADENFQLGEQNKLWRQLDFTDRLSQPTAWTAWWTQYVLGNYSVTKHAFMIATTGDKWDDDDLNMLYTGNSALRNAKRAMLNTALLNYNNAHPLDPMKDEFGEPISFK